VRTHRIRVATLQYHIRPVERFENFAAQVEALVDTAEDYNCDLLVFPEYFTCQLLTLNDVKQPIQQQIRDLARLENRIVELMRGLAKKSGLYIVAGTLPAMDPPDDETVYNECYVYGPSGEWDVQGKLHMTRFEREDWLISPHQQLKVFETDLGKLAVTICYDVRQGFLRVRYCAQARAIENQMYVVHSCTVGSLPQVPAVSLNYGQASILTPSDFPFARDGILAEGNVNIESMVIGELNLDTIRESREDGTVLPLRDSVTTKQVTAKLETVRL